MFEGYYPHTEEFFEQLWEKALIVLDANVLLDMYRYSESTRNDFLTLFERLSNRLWLPHQVALEYSRNRPDVISEQVQMYRKAKKLVSSLRATTAKETEKILSFRLHPVLSREEFQTAFEAPLTELEEKIDAYAKAHPDFFQNDPILDALLELFDGKVGNPYEAQRLEEIFAEGKDRYDKEVPPGYEDARGPNKKEGDAIYGDLVLWFQIIDQAMATDASGVIFLSNDLKEDWWWVSKGRNLGCRPELYEEIAAKAKARFYMYTSERFLHFASERIEVDVKKESIAEVRALEEKNQEDREAKRNVFVNSFMKQILTEQKQKEQLLSSLHTIIIQSALEKQQNWQEILDHTLGSHSDQSNDVAKFIEQIRKQEEQRQQFVTGILARAVMLPQIGNESVDESLTDTSAEDEGDHSPDDEQKNNESG